MSDPMEVSMRRTRIGLALLLGSCVCVGWAGEPTREELRGDWVPAAAKCDSSLRFRVGADTFELQNGTDRQSYGDVAWPSEYFGPDYQGIAVVAIPEFESSQPFTVFFNDGEKKGTAKLQILVGEESPNNAAYNALVRTGKKLNARFPLDNVVLKRCAPPQKKP
jgi:hypothetical protein